MIDTLQTARKVIGLKQSRKVVRDGEAERAFVALDAEERVRAPFCELCAEMNVPVVDAESMAQLGAAVGIEVGAAVVVVLK